MNSDQRRAFLTESLKAAAIKAQEEQDLQRQIARVTAIVNVELAKAETSRSYQCPNCGADLEGWRPSEVTGDTENDDDVSEMDDPDIDGDEDDDDDGELDAAAKHRVVAELLKHKRR